MKKILSVSFMAILAVSPMLAEAAAGTKAPVVQSRNEDKVATANYVIGAYTAITDDLAVDEPAANESYNIINAGSATGRNLMALDAKIGAVSSNAANTANGVSSSNTIAENIDALSTQVNTLATSQVTQQGVVDTVSNTVNNAKVAIYNDWANQGTGTADVYIPGDYTVTYTDSSAQSGD